MAAVPKLHGDFQKRKIISQSGRRMLIKAGWHLILNCEDEAFDI
jgi:hypothetical protein